MTCYFCGAPAYRERSPDGNEVCSAGHAYPHAWVDKQPRPRGLMGATEGGWLERKWIVLQVLGVYAWRILFGG